MQVLFYFIWSEDDK